MLANILTQRLPQPFQQTSELPPKAKQEQRAATNIAKLFQKKEEKK